MLTDSSTSCPASTGALPSRSSVPRIFQLFPGILIDDLNRCWKPARASHSPPVTIYRAITRWRCGPAFSFQALRRAGWAGFGVINGTTMIIDLIGAGISLRISQRGQVARFLEEHGYRIDALPQSFYQKITER